MKKVISLVLGAMVIYSLAYAGIETRISVKDKNGQIGDSIR